MSWVFIRIGSERNFVDLVEEFIIFLRIKRIVYIL